MDTPPTDYLPHSSEQNLPHLFDLPVFRAEIVPRLGIQGLQALAQTCRHARALVPTGQAVITHDKASYRALGAALDWPTIRRHIDVLPLEQVILGALDSPAATQSQQAENVQSPQTTIVQSQQAELVELLLRNTGLLFALKYSKICVLLPPDKLQRYWLIPANWQEIYVHAGSPKVAKQLKLPDDVKSWRIVNSCSHKRAPHQSAVMQLATNLQWDEDLFRDVCFNLSQHFHDNLVMSLLDQVPNGAAYGKSSRLMEGLNSFPAFSKFAATGATCTADACIEALARCATRAHNTSLEYFALLCDGDTLNCIGAWPPKQVTSAWA